MIHTANYIDLPFKPNGRSREGLDCWGLIWLVYKEHFKIELPSFSEFYNEKDVLKRAGMPNIARLIEYNKDNGWTLVSESVDERKEQEGDAIWIRIGRYQSHVGVVIKPGWMLHILEFSKVTTESYRDYFWKNRVKAFYRNNALCKTR